MQPEREIDADHAAQEVVNAWGLHMNAGNAQHLTADFKQLFDKACAYGAAKDIADNGRELDRLTDEQVADEQRTKKEFTDAWKAFEAKKLK
jgi:hypothetical protein